MMGRFSFLELFLALGALCSGVLLGVFTKWRRQLRQLYTVPIDPTTKLCHDCRWYKKHKFGYTNYFTKCMHPSSVVKQGDVLVNGVYHPDNMYSCSIMRSDLANKTQCGEEGQFWEAK